MGANGSFVHDWIGKARRGKARWGEARLGMGANGSTKGQQMFEESVEISEAVEAVYDLTTTLNRGDILTHEAIKHTLDLNPHEGPWDYILSKVRRRLEQERGITTWACYTVGYKLLTPDEQLAAITWRVRKSIRQIRKGHRHGESLPVRGLTVHQRRSRAFMINQVKDIEASLRANLRAQQIAIRPVATIPRRPIPVGDY